MSSQTPILFDRQAVAAQRRRAAGSGPDAFFLHDHVADILNERLDEVNRTFTKPVFVGWDAVEWPDRLGIAGLVVGDDDVLDAAIEAHDLALHLMCLHVANDPVGQLIQMRRALRPDGLMIAALFGGQTLHELRSVLAQAEADIVGGLSPRITPMGDLRDLGALLQRAGFGLPVADNFELRVEYSSFDGLLSDLRGMGERNVQIGRRPLRRDILARARDLYHQHFATAEGKLIATFDIMFLTGWAPSPDQPQPLRPGSATTRLADSLKVPETPLKDE